MEKNQLVISQEMKNDFWSTYQLSLDNVQSEDEKLTIVENQKAVYNMTSAQDYRLDDVIGKEIELVNVIVESYENIDESTGEVTQGRLTILVTADGESIATSSPTVFNDLGRAFNIFGLPSVESPLTVVAEKRTGKNNKYTAIRVI